MRRMLIPTSSGSSSGALHSDVLPPSMTTFYRGPSVYTHTIVIYVSLGLLIGLSSLPLPPPNLDLDNLAVSNSLQTVALMGPSGTFWPMPTIMQVPLTATFGLCSIWNNHWIFCTCPFSTSSRSSHQLLAAHGLPLLPRSAP